jgi:hypothetical protein
MLAKVLFAVIIELSFVEVSRGATVTGAEIVEYGVFDKVSIGPRKEPAVLTGQVDEVPMVKLMERTTIIPAVLGTTFGVTVKLIGSPAGERVNCWITWLHPKLTNPETGQASDRSDFPSRWPIGEVTPTGFTFEHPWELVPGTWTVRVIWDWRVVAEKTFNVMPPR